ncbi:hypothetical protein CLOM_g14793 [Closterium sp. NIES-68]|nr:hypothetical protein CLOM_g14793 [Closterium sp. NIES-68]GJP83087.1 hypothetical protein CLOP_g13294 [Closterium sp. NIES-67]
MYRRGSAFLAIAQRLAVLLLIAAAPLPALCGRRRMQDASVKITTSISASGGAATSAQATAGSAGLDLAALGVDTKTRLEIKALAAQLSLVDLSGIGLPPVAAAFLNKDAFAKAARAWIAKVKRRVAAVREKIRRGGSGKGKGKGASAGNSVQANKSTAVDPSLGLAPPARFIPASLPNLNTVSRYLTMGLTVDPVTKQLSWNFERSIDHRTKFLPGDEFDQGNCGSCWAYAVARAIQGAYMTFASSTYPEGAALSVQQLVDCTGAAATCRGGYPENALQYAVKNGLQFEDSYTYTGVNGKCSVKKEMDKWPITLYEQVPLPGPLGLILALQKQPVIVTIRASSEDFISYSGGIFQGYGCYSPVGSINGLSSGEPGATPVATNNTAILDHVMLAVGYNYDSPGSYLNYFVLKNSWGPNWGEGGYMRIRMENAPFGTCGMLVNRGLYPVVPVPAGTDPCTTSPCGAGVCLQVEAGTSSYRCQCPDPLVNTTNRDGTPTCTLVDICGVLPVNPCGVGKCINSGDGGYSCLCPPNFKPSKLASGQTTCVPELSGNTASAVQGTYTVKGGETCSSIYAFIGLTQEQFLQQNKGMDCENLKQGQVLNISIPASAQVCRVRYTITMSDAASQSCDAINSRFGVEVTTINANLDCSQLVPGQQICIQVGDAVSGVEDYNLCTNYQAVGEFISCENIVQWWGVSWLDLYRLNPGVNCDALSSLTNSEICTQGTPLGAVACGKVRSKTITNRKYTVAGGDSCASLVVAQFKRQPPLVQQLNRGWVCRSQSLFEGMPICIPA